MNFRQIEIFHAVYVSGSITAASRALHVSQPSVSKTLRHAVLQNLVGAAVALFFGLDPLFGVLTGSVTLAGGPARLRAC